MKRIALALLLLLTTACAGATDGALPDLPLVELPATNHVPPHGRMAIILSGDGGWRRIDDRIADRFRESGIPVVGFNTPDYYGQRRTPEEAADALAQVMRHYSAAWKSPHVVLVGYSRGADVLPFMINRLPADLQGSIDLVALLGMEPLIEFRYHPTWIPFYHPRETQNAVLPEVEKLRGQRILCVRGKGEKDSLCTSLDPGLAKVLTVEGGHHFGGHYAAVADAILGMVK
jgi:type IV secretory pathway VirJ component